jgi:hypothetical protein
MDLKPFTEEIPITLKKHDEVVFWCKRPEVEELSQTGVSGALQNKRIFEQCVTSWEGLVLDGAEFPCDKLNKKRLMKIHSALCIKVADKLIRQVLEEVEIELGN